MKNPLDVNSSNPVFQYAAGCLKECKAFDALCGGAANLYVGAWWLNPRVNCWLNQFREDFAVSSFYEKQAWRKIHGRVC